jgi:translocator assembly and maintenance protein 41
VRVSSARQAFAALLSTSPTKTVGYVGAKFLKAASSLFEK